MAWEQLQQFVWAPKTANGVYDGTSFNTYSSPLLVSNNEVSAISQLDNTNYHQTFNYSEVSRFSAITGLYNQSPSYGNYLAWIYKIGGGKLFLDYSTSEYLRIRFYVGDEYIELFSGAVQNSYSFSFGMLKDDATQKGCITFATNNGSLCHAYIRNDSGTISISDLYNAIKNADKESTSEAGAGSGYIGNSLVSNKKMVGFNVPTSSAEATKTESVNDVSASAVSGKPKIGNGFARIKFLRNPASIWKTTDISHCKTVSWNGSWSSLSEWYGTDWILSMNNSNANYFSSFDGTDGVGTNKSGTTNCTILIPINRVLLERFKVKAGLDAGASGAYSICQLGFMKLENGELQSVSGSDINADNVSPIQQYTKVLETPQYADYFLVNVCDGKWHFQDLELNY